MKMKGKKRISLSICCQTMLFKTPGVASYIRDNPKTNMAVTPSWTKKMEVQPHIPVKAFFPPAAEPAGITFNTLNLTVLDSGLKL